MPDPDLRSFLAAYETEFPSQVWRVREEIPPDYAATAWVLELDRQGASPILVFERVKGFGMPVVVNLFASRQRIAWILGTTADRLAETWIELARKPIPPVLVPRGPVQERVLEGPEASVLGLPISTHFAGDAGRYVTAGIGISKDPDTGVRNLTYARMQVKGPDLFALSFHSRGHHWDYLRRYEAQGRNMPMAVAIGAHPAILIGASTRGPMDLDEYDICGSLLGAPVELVRARTIDVEVPAAAEIVLEGEVVANVREPEGPFGEFTGYSTGRSTNNVFRLSAVTMRSSPIYLDVTPGATAEHLYLGRTPKEAMVLSKLRDTYPVVRALHYPRSGTHFHCYVSIDKALEGQPQQVAVLLLGLDPYVKLCVIVDSDIDPANEAEVLWAVATRTQAASDVSIIRGGLTNLLDPSSRDGTSDKMIIDATRPAGWEAQRTAIPADVEGWARERVRDRLAARGLAAAR